MCSQQPSYGRLVCLSFLVIYEPCFEETLKPCGCFWLLRRSILEDLSGEQLVDLLGRTGESVVVVLRLIMYMCRRNVTQGSGL